MKRIQNLFDQLGLRMNGDNVLIGVRRLGKFRTDGLPRPILLIFKIKEDRVQTI